MLIAAVLDFQQSPHAGSGMEGHAMACPYYIHARGPQHRRRIGVWNHGAHRRQRRDFPIVQSGRASHHDRLRGAGLRDVAHGSAQVYFALVGDGAGVDDGEISSGGIVDLDGAMIGKGLAHEFRIVLVRPAPKRMEVDVHGRTVSPSNKVHTRSFNPLPLRSRRSTPMSRRPRPPEKTFPRPPAMPNSVGAFPMPNGS